MVVSPSAHGMLRTCFANAIHHPLSDWWNPLFQDITANCATKYLFTGQIGATLLASGAIPSGQSYSASDIVMRTIAYNQNSQEGQLLEAMLEALGTNPDLLRQLMNSPLFLAGLYHISVIKAAIIQGLGASECEDSVLVVRLRVRANGQILAGPEANSEEGPSLAEWGKKYGKLAETFMGKVFGEEQEMGEDLENVFAM